MEIGSKREHWEVLCHSFAGRTPRALIPEVGAEAKFANWEAVESFRGFLSLVHGELRVNVYALTDRHPDAGMEPR